jgi:hypothetical protein
MCHPKNLFLQEKGFMGWKIMYRDECSACNSTEYSVLGGRVGLPVITA